MEKFIRDSFAPLQSGVYGFRNHLGSIGTNFADKKLLEKQIQDLESSNHSLSLENQQLKEYKTEVERLRTILNFQQVWKDQFEMEPAKVIARSPNNWYKVLTIDKGTDSGISKDMAVISPDGLVGRVGSTSKSVSQVWLISDSEMAVGAILQESRETMGIVEGVGQSDTLRMINIPYYSNIKTGERVICSGLSQTYPKGIPIGTVKETKRESSGLVLSAVLTPAVSFDKLEEVLVIKKTNQLSEDDSSKEE